MNTIRTHIMRRIYIAYALRILFGARTRAMGLMLVSSIVLFKLVSVLAVIENFARVNVADVVHFLLSAVRYTETVTLLMLVVFMYASISFVRSCLPLRGRRFA